MPSAAPVACSASCPHTRPCPVHGRGRWEGRPSSTARGYGYEHQKWRAAVLWRDPQCKDPEGRHPGEERKSEHADHIIPVADDPSRRYDVTNGQGLCRECHNTKTGREGARRRWTK